MSKIKHYRYYKVIAGEKLEGANKFYRKNGFVPAKQIIIHGNEVSNVYFRKGQRTEACPHVEILLRNFTG